MPPRTSEGYQKLTRGTGMVGFLMRSGIVKTSRQGEIILIIAAIVIAGGAFFIWSSARGVKTPATQLQKGGSPSLPDDPDTLIPRSARPR